MIHRYQIMIKKENVVVEMIVPNWPNWVALFEAPPVVHEMAGKLP